MSGTLDWKPSTLGVQPARPSSAVGFHSRGPSSIHQTRASPSSIDLSGCHEHPPLASIVDHNRFVKDHVLLRNLPERAEGGNRNGGGGFKRRYPNMTNVDEAEAVQPEPEIPPGLEAAPATSEGCQGPRATKARKQGEHNFGSVETWGGITFDDETRLNFVGPHSTVRPSPSQSTQGPPISVSETGSLFITGWSVGAFFQHRQRRGFSHRVYDGPPDGTLRHRIGPESLVVDFMRPYKIVALFFNDVYLAAQFRVPAAVMMDGRMQEAKSVWGNMRKGSLWLCELVDPEPEHIQDQDVKVYGASARGAIGGKVHLAAESGSDFSSISEANSLEQALAESLRTDVPGTEEDIRAMIRVDDKPWEHIQQYASASSTTKPPRSPGEAE